MLKNINHFMVKIILLSVTVMAFAFHAEAKIGDSLRISGNQAVIYSGPNASSSKMMNITSGMELIEMERLGGWVLVTVRPSGVQGWLSEDHLVAAKKPPVKQAAKKRTILSASAARKALSALGPVRTITLADLGLRKGYVFKGTQGGHTENFFFKTPMDSSVRGGVFRLSYRAANVPLTMSNITVYANDIPLHRVDVIADSMVHEFAVVLQSSMFRDGMVKISAQSGTLGGGENCLDLRSGGGFLHILPTSALDITYSSIDKSIRDAWRMLPQKVTLSLPAGTLDATQFAAAMSVMELLTNDGKKVVIKRLPEIGDVVVAAKAEIIDELNRRGMRMNRGFVELKSDDVFRTPTDNLNLIKTGDAVSIAVSEPYDVQPLYMVDDRWELLAAGRHYDINKSDRLYSNRALPRDSIVNDSSEKTEGGDSLSKTSTDHYSLPLFQLDTSPHLMSNETVWSTTLSPRDLPSGTRLDMLSLSIISPVRWEADPTFELYVFLNNVLVLTRRLEDDGKKHNYSVPLPEEYQRQYNTLRFVVQHDVETGNCRGVSNNIANDFVQITPDTAIIVKKTESEPSKFSGLAQYFSSGFDTIIAEKYLSNPENALNLIARIVSDLPLVMDYSRIRFAKESEALNPSGPFVVFGNFNPGNIDAPVRMDKGVVELRDKYDETFFSVNVLPKITIAQIVNAFSAYGLIVTPSDLIQHNFNEKLRLIEGDVAFIDSHGVLLHIDSKQPTLAKLYYPDTKDWFAVLGAYRFWLLGLLWFLLSLAIVYLFRLSRRQRQDDHDVDMPTSDDLHTQRIHHTNINTEDDDTQLPNK